MTCENEGLAETLAGSGVKSWFANLLGSNSVTAKLCSHIGVIHGEENKPSVQQTPPAFENEVDSVGEVQKHGIRKGYFDKDKAHHKKYLDSGYEIRALKKERATLQKRTKTAESEYDENARRFREQSSKMRLSQTTEKRLLIVAAILETIVVSICFKPLAQDIFTLVAMGALPGLLVVFGAHCNGILMRCLENAQSKKCKQAEENDVDLRSNCQSIKVLLMALLVTMTFFILIVSWFRSTATVNSDLLDREIWLGPIPSVSSFTLLFASINLLTFVVGSIASWFANHPDVIKSYRQLTVSAQHFQVLKEEMKRMDSICLKAQRDYHEAFVDRLHAKNVASALIDKNLANTHAHVNVYRNAVYTARTDDLDPFTGVPVGHHPIKEDESDLIDWTEPQLTTLSDLEVGLDEELDRLLDV